MTDPPLHELLLDLDREDLARVLLELADRHPDLIPTIAALSHAARSTPARKQPLPPVNLAEMQTSFRAVLASSRSRYFGGVSGTAVAQAAGPWIERAAAHQAAGDGTAALEILAVIADELAEAGDALQDEGGDLHRCIQELGRRLAQTLRSLDLSAAEQSAWHARIETWSTALGSLDDDSGFAVTLEALKGKR